MADIFKKKLTQWDILATNMKALLPEMDNVAGDHAAFTQTVADGLELVARQEAAVAAASETVAKRRLLERQGDHLREFLEASLRRKFGVGSPRLREFGIRPRDPKSKRRLQPDDPATHPIPTVPAPAIPTAAAAAPVAAPPLLNPADR